MQDISETSQLLRSRNGRVFSDVELELLNDVTGVVETTEAMQTIPETFQFLSSKDPWLTDRELVRHRTPLEQT